MLSKKVSTRRNPLTTAQKSLLEESIKKLFSISLYEDEVILDVAPEKRPEYLKEMVIKNALSAIILDNDS